MKKMLSLVFVVAMLAGCEQLKEPQKKDAESRACTKEQLDGVVLSEIKACKEGYMSAYCYNRAVIAHCQKRTDT